MFITLGRNYLLIQEITQNQWKLTYKSLKIKIQYICIIVYIRIFLLVLVLLSRDRLCLERRIRCLSYLLDIMGPEFVDTIWEWTMHNVNIITAGISTSEVEIILKWQNNYFTSFLIKKSFILSKIKILYGNIFIHGLKSKVLSS